MPATDKKIRWGIIGPGSIAKSFAGGVANSRTGELVAIATRNPGKAGLAESFAGARIVDGYAAFGIAPAPKLLFTSFASTLGMTHILLPYMILALYAVMRRIDPDHLKAAASLGARPRAAFAEVFLPLSLPGVVNGSLLVFVTCLGFFVTPILLGTPRDMMISQLINQQIEELLAWGFASALAVILLVATALVLAAYNRFAGLDRLWG